MFATRGGLFFLDVADYFINQFGVAAIGLVEVVLIAWVFRKARCIRKTCKCSIRYSNSVHGGKFVLGFITPLVLGYMMFGLIKSEHVETT